jgi:hypothetical protein
MRATPLSRYPLERDPTPTVREGGWTSESVRKGAENLAPTEIRSPERPATGKSLYRLRYTRPPLTMFNIKLSLFLNTNKLPDDGTLLPKHVSVDT